jgi:hypothetical protein
MEKQTRVLQRNILLTALYIGYNEQVWKSLYSILAEFDDMIYLTAVGLTPGGSSTAHIYTQTIHRIQRTEHT